VGDRERQNRASKKNLVLLRDTEGQGETPDCGQIAVRTWVLQTILSEPTVGCVEARAVHCE
jgi:hypothetical protein